MIRPLLLVATIAFGALGPLQRITFADRAVQMEVRYRLAQDRNSMGEGGTGPSVATGTLMLVVSGRRRTYDIADVLPIHEHHVILPLDPKGGCGTTQTLTRRGAYAVVESVWAEKGCRPAATFIDLTTGRVAESVDVDHRWDHRFDVLPGRFAATDLYVDRIDRIKLSQESFSGSGSVHPLMPWNFAVLHAHDKAGRPRLIAFEISARDIDGSVDAGANILPPSGADVAVGRLEHSSTLDYYPDDREIRFDPSVDARYAKLRPTWPPKRARLIRRNQWLRIADDYAEHGSLTAATEALAKMLTHEDYQSG